LSSGPTAVPAPTETWTVRAPWASLRLLGPVPALLPDRLAPFVLRREEEGDRLASPPLATIRFEPLDRCASAGLAGGPGGAPLALHQGQRGTLLRTGSGHLVINHSRRVHYHVESGAVPVVRLCLSGGRPGIDAFQVLRGLLVGAGMRAERLVPLHGAVLSLGGHGVLLGGGRNAGKTSFALGLLSRGARDVALVANDKVLLDTATLRAHGLPYAIAMQAGTLARLPALAGLPRRRVGARELFWPADVAAALGVGLRASVELKEQWWCDLDLTRGAAVLQPGPQDRSRFDPLAEFSSNLLPVWLLELLGLGAPAPSAAAVDVPVYRLGGNPWRSWSPHPDNELW
jgi:hypothetical protein